MWSLILKVLVTVRYFIDRLTEYIFGLYYDSKRKFIPPSRDPLISESAASLSLKLRNKTVSCEEVVKAFISRIKEVNDVINAVVDCRFEAAVEEAKSIDEDIKNGSITPKDFDDRPFLGIPFTTKETLACKGLRSTFGVIARQNKIAEEDSEAVRLMKNAGGILLGVCNVPQLGMWQETINPVYGRTNNPYNSTRNVGGSTGGDAAALSAGCVPIAIGTDVGGSVRIPAFMCGVFGHKPTTGLVSPKGSLFYTGKEKFIMSTPGTLTKTTSDIIPFLNVLVDKNVDKLKLDEKVNVKDLQIYYQIDAIDWTINPFTKEMKSNILKVVEYFEKNSNNIPQKLQVPELKYGRDLWSYWLNQQDGFDMGKSLTNHTGRVNGFVELLKIFIGRSDYTAGVILLLLNSELPIMDKICAEEITNKLTQQLISKLGENGVLIYPSAPWTASYHNTALLRPFNAVYFAIWNVFRFPVTQVPLGLDSQGMPWGVQIIAAPYQDHLCIAVAKELEKAFGGYVPPYNVKN